MYPNFDIENKYKNLVRGNLTQPNLLRCMGDEFKNEAAERRLLPEHSRDSQNSLVSTLVNDAVIAGVDEAGRGPLAGPVVAAAVIVNDRYIINGINDSKKLSAKVREQLFQKITKHYVYTTGIAWSEEIDKINILEATKKACISAVAELSNIPDIILVDGNMKFADKRFISIVKGDQLSYSIATASIIAKVIRDNIMLNLAEEFPKYHWHKNCGYGTKAHLEAIKQYGLTPHHRKTYKIRSVKP